MAAPFKNLYHKRAVAESAAKPCFICYKASSTVLITPDSRDFFYVCAGHLTDRGFAVPASDDGTPVKPQDEAKRARDAELQKEIDKVKTEYEEKAKKRKDKKSKGKDEDEKKDAAEDEDKVADDKDKKERDEKINDLTKATGDNTSDAKQDAPAAPKKADGPRVFALHKSIFQMRTSKIQSAQMAKRNQERMRSPGFFPAVPKDL